MASNHRWSSASARKLDSCETPLQEIMNSVLAHFPFDVVIIEGHRSNARQQQLFDAGKSKALPGQSKHNRFPSEAVDAAPLVDGKIQWNNRDLWIQFASFVKAIGASQGYDIRWGGDWDGDLNIEEHSFLDFPHFEYRGKL